MTRILYSLLGIAIGIAILKYSPRILKFIGHDPDAERVFSGGLGGTNFFIKIFGLAIIIGSFFYLFGFF
ncbi:MAG: hypothetical protein AAB871_00920 [Patescibacteria group bacterium]